MTVTLPDNFPNERKYIIDLFLKDFLGLDYSVKYHKKPEYLFEFSGKSLKVNDHFFFRFSTINDLLRSVNLPGKIIYVEDELLPEDDLPVLYGKDYIHKDKNEIICDVDIFAGAFVLLTSFEQLVLSYRDELNRFPEEHSFVLKNRLHTRPVVNEYAMFLKNCFEFLGLEVNYNANFERKLLVEVLKLGKIRSLFSRLFSKSNVSGSFVRYDEVLKDTDSWSLFEFFIRIAKDYEYDVEFFFFSDENKIRDFYNLDDKTLKSILNTLKRKKLKAGILADGFDDADFLASKKFLKTNDIRFFRGKVDFSQDAELLEKAGFENDFSIAAETDFGFYRGICTPFYLYDFRRRQKSKLKTYPVIVSSYAVSNNEPVERQFWQIERLYDFTKKYQGSFLVLWENYLPFKKDYEIKNKILELILGKLH